MNIMCKSNNLTMLLVPIRSQQNVFCTFHLSRLHVKWTWSKQQSYTCSSWRCIVGWRPKQRLYSFWQRKMIILPNNVFTSCPLPFLCLVESNGMDPMIKEQHKVVWIFYLHIHTVMGVWHILLQGQLFLSWRKSILYSVSGGEQIIEVVDFLNAFWVLISFLQITVKGLKLLDLLCTNNTHTHKSEQLLTYKTNLKPEMQG